MPQRVLARVLMQTQIFLPFLSPEASRSLCRARRARSPRKSPRPPIRRHNPQDAPHLLQAQPQAPRPPQPVLLPNGQAVLPRGFARKTGCPRNDCVNPNLWRRPRALPPSSALPGFRRTFLGRRLLFPDLGTGSANPDVGLSPQTPQRSAERR